MRLFYAIKLPHSVKDALLHITDQLRPCIHSEHWTQRDNYHLTLAFLGEMSAAQVQTAMRVLYIQQFEPFTLTCEGLGYFRRGSRAIWWVGVTPSAALTECHDTLSRDLAAAGLPVDVRNYRPHLTLGREATTPEGFSPEGLAQTAVGLEIPVSVLSLMESVRIDGKLVYRETASQSASSFH